MGACQRVNDSVTQRFSVSVTASASVSLCQCLRVSVSVGVSACHSSRQLRETESVRDGVQRDLADCERRLAEQQDRWRWRERDLSAALEEARAAGHRLEDDKKNLEIRLSAASQEAADLKVGGIPVRLPREGGGGSGVGDGTVSGQA